MAGNIQIAYHASKNELLFIDDKLSKAIDFDLIAGRFDKFILKIHQEDREMVLSSYANFLAGIDIGTIKFRVAGPQQLEWLAVTPFMLNDDEETIIYANVSLISNEITHFDSITSYANRKNSILNMLGHDLRGPLNLAKSLMQMLNKMVKDQAVLKRTQHVSSIIEQSITLINDLLAREFLETVNTPFFKTRINLAVKIGEYVEECQRSAAVAERKFIFDCDRAEVDLEVDEAKLMQVMNNLISNALKFTRPAGKITISLRDKINYVRLCVTDDGIGIPADLIDVIFERFTPARRPGLNGEPTIGLGLSIVKDIVSWHGAIIKCESTVDKGTSFIIDFPTDQQ